MNAIELLADDLKRNGEMLKMVLADFSDADMVQRPCPGANHAMWQLGHLIASETGMVNAAKPGAMPELPAGFRDRFGEATQKLEDPASFPGKAQLLELFSQARQASVQWTKSLSEQDLAKPSPSQLSGFAPTIGHLVLMLSTHLTMHLGQMQVTRRKLGKPVLF